MTDEAGSYHVVDSADAGTISFESRDDDEGILGTLREVRSILCSTPSRDEAEALAEAEASKCPEKVFYVIDNNHHVVRCVTNQEGHTVSWIPRAIAVCVFAVTCVVGGLAGLQTLTCLTVFVGAATLYSILSRLRVANELEAAVVVELLILAAFIGVALA